MVESRIKNKLSKGGIQKLWKAGRYSDGGSLYFVIDKRGYKQWVFYFPWLGKRREMGLGSYPKVDLAEARVRKKHEAHILSNNIDPIKNRKEQMEIMKKA